MSSDTSHNAQRSRSRGQTHGACAPLLRPLLSFRLCPLLCPAACVPGWLPASLSQCPPCPGLSLLSVFSGPTPQLLHKDLEPWSH